MLRVRKGHTESGLDFGYLTAFRESYPLFQKLRAAAGRPELRFQVEIPVELIMVSGCRGPRRRVWRG